MWIHRIEPSWPDHQEGFQMGQTGQNRWYDRQCPALSKSLELMDHFPDPMVNLIAHGVMELTTREGPKPKLSTEETRSLGWEKVSALYRSKRKQRDYDQMPELHTLLNKLHMMPDDERTATSRQLLELVILVYQSLEYLEKSGMEMTQEEVQHIIQTYQNKGFTEGQQWVVQEFQPVNITHSQSRKSRTVVMVKHADKLSALK